MTNTDTVIHEWNMNSPNNQSKQTHTKAIIQNSKTRRDEDTKMENSISGSANQTLTLLHYTVYAPSNTRMEILKFFENWIVIFIIDYFMKVSLF